MGEWIRADVFTSPAGLDAVCASLTGLGVNGFQVTDPGDLDDFLARKTGYWDYYDEKLLELRNAEARVTVWISDDGQGRGMLSDIRRELIRLRELDAAGEWGRLEAETSRARDEDWANEWKKYYHPLRIGGRLVVCPTWEEYIPQNGDVVVKLDPGMAFGSGTHESTRLCAYLMEKYLKPGMDVLDAGCGSGILSIAAALLGAGSVIGLDMDETAVRVASENAAENGVAGKCRFERELLGDRRAEGFGLVTANLVADLIIGYAAYLAGAVAKGGALIVSGVIDEREEEVAGALEAAGLMVAERARDGGWVALCGLRK